MASTQAAVVLGASGSVGNALIKELIRNGSFQPIATVVRRSQPDQVAMAREAGVDTYLTKPYNDAELLQVIRELVDEPSETRRARMAGRPVEFRCLPRNGTSR